MNSIWNRLAAVLSVVWLAAGGYWSFTRHSYEWRWARRTTRDMCAGEADYARCVADNQALYSPSPHWLPIVAEVVAGLLAIWLLVWTVRWIVGRKAA